MMLFCVTLNQLRGWLIIFYHCNNCKISLKTTQAFHLLFGFAIVILKFKICDVRITEDSDSRDLDN